MEHAELSNLLVLDGLPALSLEKRGPFMKILRQKMEERFKSQNIQSFEVTLNADGAHHTGPFAFISFSSVSDADKAFPLLNKWRLTKADEFKCYYWADFDRYASIPDTFAPPEASETLSRSELKANDFLLDPQARPQFILKGGADINVELYWFAKGANLIRKPNNQRNDDISTWSEMDHHDRGQLQKGIPEKMPMWSPQGTFLVTHHRDGLKFWGGKGLVPLSEILVDDLQYVGISPSETYAVTYSRSYDFWNILEGRKIKSLPGEVVMKRGSARCPFKHNADDSLVGAGNFLVGGTESLSFYVASTMKLISPNLKKYTFETPGLRSFEWSPTHPSIFACVFEGSEHSGWCVEVNTIDMEGTVRNVARRNILDAKSPERDGIRSPAVTLMWNPEGTHITARVCRLKQGHDVLDYLIFSVSEKHVTVHAIDARGRRIQRFWWAAGKPRFALLYLASATEPTTIAFFQSDATGCRLIGDCQGEYDSVWWSPKGLECVATNNTKSSLDFIVVNDRAIERVARDKEHKGFTHLTWDPSGRYVASFVSTVDTPPLTDAGYKVWSVFGDMLFENNNMRNRFSHLSWRPLPRTVLSPEELAAIESSLPEQRRRYEAEDLEQQRKAEEVAEAKRTKIVARYREHLDGISRDALERGLAAKRAQLIQSSPAMKRQQLYLEKNSTVVTETFVDEVIESEVDLSAG